MSEIATKRTCRRGHERTPENVRVRVLVRNGKESVIHECLVCKHLTAAERKGRQTDA